jgi:BON domain
MKKDLKLQRAVMAELAWDPSVDASEISVSAKSGIVMLNGTVKSLPEKWAAERAAQHVSSVKAVTDEIVVAIPGQSQRSDLGPRSRQLLRVECFRAARSDQGSREGRIDHSGWRGGFHWHI